MQSSCFRECNSIEANIYPNVRLKTAVQKAKLSVSKSFLIHLDNKDDLFSKKLHPILKYISMNAEVISWDLTTENTAILADACEFHLAEDIIIQLIEEKKSSLSLFSVINNKVHLNLVYLNVEFDEDSLLREITEKIYANQTAAEQFPECNEISNLESKLPAPACVVSTPSQQIVMDQLIQCLNEVQRKFQQAVAKATLEEKPLAIYLHNGLSSFSVTFLSLVTTTDINKFLADFVFFACDLNTSDRNLIFDKNHGFGDQFNIIRSKLLSRESGLFIYKLSNQKFIVDSCFFGNVGSKQLYVDVYNMQKIFEEELQNRNELIEKKSILSAKASIEATHGKHVADMFEFCTLKQSIEVATRLEPSYLRKVLMIYCHVEKSPFAEFFLNHLKNPNNSKRLAYSTHMLPWDVTNARYRTVLQSLVRDQFDLRRIETMIQNEEPGLFLFVSCKNRPQLFSFISWPINEDDMWFSILQVIQSFEEQHEKTDFAELSACSGSPYKYPLGVIIPEFCLCRNIQSRKILHILFYNHTTDNLYKNTQTVKSELSTNVRNSFCSVNWNISDDTIRPKLLLAVERYFDMEKMELLLKKKKSGLFTFMPITESLTLFSFLDEKSSASEIKKDMLKSFKYFAHEKITEEKLPDDCQSMGAVQFQQLIFDQLGDRDYDCFCLDKYQAGHLKDKIGFGLFGAPVQCDEDAMLLGREFEKYDEKQQKKINEAYKKIVENSQKYSEVVEDIVMTCIFNCIAPLPEVRLKRLTKDGNYNPRNDFRQVPVFVIRKCVGKAGKACRIFIDHDLRVYNTWSEYLENNNLPEGIFIAPKDGRYQGDAWGNVRVEHVMSPACGLGPAILKGVDIGAAVVGLGAGAAGVAASLIAIPAAPVILTGAAVVSATAGGYAIVRSIVTIVDRVQHDETMSLSNSEARGAYLNIIGGAMGFAGSGATMALSYYARSGANIGMIARGAVNTVTGANIVINGASFVNSSYEVISRWISDDEPPSALTILQLSSSILFFGHAVYNVRSANTIIYEAQAQAMNDINNSLRSNRHRKTFNKMAKQTIREAGNVQKGQAEVISYMKNLNNRDEVLAALTRGNKAMNKNGIKYSVRDGEIQFNGVKINVDEFSNLSSTQRSDYLVNLPPMQEPTPITCETVKTILNLLETKGVIKEIYTAVIKSNSFTDTCTRILNIFSSLVQEKLLNFLTLVLRECELDISIDRSLLSLFTSNQIPIEVLKLIMQFFKKGIVDDERRYVQQTDNKDENNFLSRRNINRIVWFMEKAILVASLTIRDVVQLIVVFIKDCILEQIRDRIVETDNRTRPCSARRRIICGVCNGIRSN